MTAPLQTLNATVAQIEAMLRAGSSVQEVAAFYSEPAVNVYAVQRSMDRDTGATKPAATTPAPRPLASVPTPPASASAPTVDTLVVAAARSTSKRTQALGVKLHDLATLVRQRLADEREAAEKAERTQREREAATAEVTRLREQLRAAEAKLRPARRGGVRLRVV